ncbi:hypothetical protein M3Y99_00182700 [Aphelenchoides fujianensis]|nr:hypothetical protein M3Y99_00182700 [Aphelenchoides fujianensis]
MVSALTLKLILLLHTHLTRNKGRIGRRSQVALSLLSCFCGGVILGVCLLELLPEAREALEKIEAKLNWKAGYPYVELFTGIGLFIVYLVEELIGKFFGLKHDHSDEGAQEAFKDIEVEQGSSDFSSDSTKKATNGDELGPSDATPSPRPSTPATSSASLPVGSKANDEHHHTHRKALANALSFVLATHLPHLAGGIRVQDEIVSISSLFFGIISHKALVAFSVGMSLTRALNHNKKIIVLLSTGSENTPKAIVSAILNCFSILAPERHNDSHPKAAPMASHRARMGGFLAMTPEHDDHAPVSH